MGNAASSDRDRKGHRLDSDLSAHDLQLRLLRENKRLRRQVTRLRALQELAYRDGLTGLRNRRYFDERLEEEMARVGRHPTSVGALLLIDLNDFKSINDQQGHQAGDEALRFVGELLERTFRLQDLCCRTGGDEFMVILPDTDEDGALQAIRRLQRALTAANGDRNIPVSLAAGAASWPADGVEGATLVERADRAMYTDKLQQKARQTVHPSHGGDTTRGRLSLVP